MTKYTYITMTTKITECHKELFTAHSKELLGVYLEQLRLLYEGQICGDPYNMYQSAITATGLCLMPLIMQAI